MAISLREILGIYRDVDEGLRQQSLPAEYQAFTSTFPREPIFVARGLEAAFGLKLEFRILDFYAGEENYVPDDRRDLFSFYEYRVGNEVRIYLNSNKINSYDPKNGNKLVPLISIETFRFILLKEMFNAVIRKAVTVGLVAAAGPMRNMKYPDTVGFPEFMSAHLDWISENFSVYAFSSSEYSPAVSVENAAELLALMFLVDIAELYTARKKLDISPKPTWDVAVSGDVSPDSPTADRRYSLFDYEGYASRYGVKDRLIIVLVKTDFIIKIVEALRAIVGNLSSIGINVDMPPLRGDHSPPVVLSNVNGEVFVVNGDAAHGERLRAAAAEFLAALGYYVPDVHSQPRGSGSWWGKVWARLTDGVTSDEARIRAKLAEDVMYGAASVHTSSEIASSIATIRAVLQEGEECSLDLGLFVMVRVISESGKPLIVSKRLTVRDRALLDSLPRLLEAPAELLGKLGKEEFTLIPSLTADRPGPSMLTQLKEMGIFEPPMLPPPSGDDREGS